MWNKLFVFAALVVAFVIIFSIMREQEKVQPVNKEAQLSRQATKVVMYERNRKTGKVLEVSAREVSETGEKVARLKDFVLTQAGDLTMSGTEAVYDRARSYLEVQGRVHLRRSDGSLAVLEGLKWDRKDNVAHSDRPVRIEWNDGVITSERAEFKDDFSKIAFIGRVHARIMQNILNP